MTQPVPQPDAARIPDRTLHGILDALRPQVGSARPREIEFHGGYTNDLAEVRLDDGRTLMVKRGRYDWSVQRYRTSRIASGLLRERAGILTPAPLPLPDGLDPRPLEAYWRIDLPTLDDVWPSLTDAERDAAMRSWGALIRRAHAIRLSGHGPLPDSLEQAIPAEQFLEADLGARLLPAVAAHWPEGQHIVENLLRDLPDLARSLPAGGSLLHGDLHAGNILCERGEGGVRCVGFIDLETAQSGPAESDLARLEITATTLFSRPIRRRYLQRLWEGYGRDLDADALAFFRAYHYVNMGFHSALIGHEEHAAEVARAARGELQPLLPEPAPMVA